MTTRSSRPSPGTPCPTKGEPLQWHRPCVSYAVDGRDARSTSSNELATTADAAFFRWLTIECEGQPVDMQVRRLAPSAYCRKAEYNKDGPNVNTIAFVGYWDELGYTPGAFALTTVWHDTRTGEILDADIQINETLGPYGKCPETGCPRENGRLLVDLGNVLTHEVGHFFGLGHTSDEEATMYGRSSRGDIQKRTLADDDREGFCNVYPPGSLTRRCNFVPRGGLELDCRRHGLRAACTLSAVGSPVAGFPPWPAVVALVATLFWRRRQRRPASGGRHRK